MGEFVYRSDGGIHRFCMSVMSDTGAAGVQYLQGTIVGLPPDAHCQEQSFVYNLKNNSESKHAIFGKYATLQIDGNNRHTSDLSHCFNITLKATSKDYSPTVHLDLGGAYWYGGPELSSQHWPIDSCIPEHVYMSTDYLFKPEWNPLSGPVLERYWINSNGVGIRVDKDVPLHVSWDVAKNKKFSLMAHFDGSQYASTRVNASDLPVLSINICKGRNVKAVHQAMTDKFISRPEGIPDSRMIRSPIWSTWAKYKVFIDQRKVLEFADEILQNGFPNSQLEIDDMFSSRYGDLDFSPKKFPDPRAMIRQLHDKGFRVIVWVTPFANFDSTAFEEGVEKNFWVKDSRGDAPALVRWWQGIGAILDVTNPDAVNWYTRRLRKMQEYYGVDSFKFDAGELCYLPLDFSTFSPLTSPGDYTHLYAKLVSSFGGMVEMRSCFQSHKYPIFIRVMDMLSLWGYDNGLRSLLPKVFTIGLLGYPYVLPDMIGGNAYGEDGEFNQTVLPSRELYIRWLEVTAYLPSMQFSLAPWQYDEEVVKLTKKYVTIHEDFVTPILLETAKEAKMKGTPLIRPLWWIAPEDDCALQNDDEFLVGNSLLVAPILDEGRRDRDVYLPEGRWRDGRTDGDVIGGQWLKGYNVDLDELAFFIKL